jgi:hypothetical protein
MDTEHYELLITLLESTAVHNTISLVFRFAEHQGVAALPAVMPVGHGSHEDPSTTLFRWALSSQAVDLPIFIHLNKATLCISYTGTH